MIEFTISLVTNVALIVILVAVLLNAQKRIVEEKLVTFAGCLGAITNGIARNEFYERLEMTALSLSYMKGTLNKSELQWRLERAGCLRLFRAESSLADIGGEHMRKLSLDALSSKSDDGREVTQIWTYIDGVLDGRAGCEKEPSERFGDEVLAKAQYQIEAQLLDLYRSELQSSPPKLFG
jgi:hypothetical protein